MDDPFGGDADEKTRSDVEERENRHQEKRAARPPTGPEKPDRSSNEACSEDGRHGDLKLQPLAQAARIGAVKVRSPSLHVPKKPDRLWQSARSPDVERQHHRAKDQRCDSQCAQAIHREFRRPHRQPITDNARRACAAALTLAFPSCGSAAAVSDRLYFSVARSYRLSSAGPRCRSEAAAFEDAAAVAAACSPMGIRSSIRATSMRSSPAVASRSLWRCPER